MTGQVLEVRTSWPSLCLLVCRRCGHTHTGRCATHRWAPGCPTDGTNCAIRPVTVTR